MIPKVIHYCWFGNNPLTDLNKECLESWRKQCHDYKIKLWNEANSPMEIPYLIKAASNKNWANMSNFVRLYAIYTEGGIYLDCDMKLIKPLDSFLKHKCFMGWQGYNIYKEGINNAIIGAEAANEFIGGLLDEYPNKFDGTEAAAYSSPIFISEKLVRLGLRDYCDEPTEYQNISLYPIRYFYPLPYKKKFDLSYIFPDTYGIHFWEGTWVKKSGKASALSTCLKLLKKISNRIDFTGGIKNLNRIFSLRKKNRPQFNINKNENQVTLCAIVKNANDYIIPFFEHYEKLGVDKFVILDNESTDSTLDLVPNKSNIAILRSSIDLKDYSNEIWLKNYLANHFSKKGWCLSVDIDELFDYPLSDKITFKKFIEYLNVNKFTAVITHMLDMFAMDEDEGRTILREQKNLKKAYGYYDIENIVKIDYQSCRLKGIDNRRNKCSNQQIKFHFGGIRKKLFKTMNCISKHSLLWMGGRERIIHSHCVENAVCADVSGVILHYKFAGDWIARTRNYVRDQYAKNPEYQAIMDYIGKETSFKKFPSEARKFIDVQNLIREDFVQTSSRYEGFSIRNSSK